MTVLVGHSGAEAVWATASPRPPAAASSTPGATGAAPSTTTATRHIGPTDHRGRRASVNSWRRPLAYTLAQVQQHATASSCWTVVSSGVYDVTSWIAQHPGGSGDHTDCVARTARLPSPLSTAPSAARSTAQAVQDRLCGLTARHSLSLGDEVCS
ncbi:MAG: hypothetical protein IPL93_04410 [Actinomycetales bacterium]|nr:hypothetical protein [Actinomycetales bacterium]